MPRLTKRHARLGVVIKDGSVVTNCVASCFGVAPAASGFSDRTAGKSGLRKRLEPVTRRTPLRNGNASALWRLGPARIRTISLRAFCGGASTRQAAADGPCFSTATRIRNRNKPGLATVAVGYVIHAADRLKHLRAKPRRVYRRCLPRQTRRWRHRCWTRTKTRTLGLMRRILAVTQTFVQAAAAARTKFNRGHRSRPLIRRFYLAAAEEIAADAIVVCFSAVLRTFLRRGTTARTTCKVRKTRRREPGRHNSCTGRRREARGAAKTSGNRRPELTFRREERIGVIPQLIAVSAVTLPVLEALFSFLATEPAVLNRKVQTRNGICGIRTILKTRTFIAAAARTALRANTFFQATVTFNAPKLLWRDKPLILGEIETRLAVYGIRAEFSALLYASAAARTGLGGQGSKFLGSLNFFFRQNSFALGEVQTLIRMRRIVAIRAALLF